MRREQKAALERGLLLLDKAFANLGKHYLAGAGTKTSRDAFDRYAKFREMAESELRSVLECPK